MAVVALVFALALVEILMPAYDAFLGRPIVLHYLQDWPLLLLVVLVAAAAGLVSGIYPALVLSGFRPVTALRSNQSGQVGSGGLRSALVVLQFTVSIGLAITTLVVFTQIDFARNQALGFRRDNILVVGTGRMTASARESFMAQLRAHPGVTGVASSGDTPFSQNLRVEAVRIPGQPTTLTPEMLQITPEFIDLYGMKLVAGRLLSDKRGEDITTGGPDARNDGHNLLINEAAARYFGFTVRGAVGKTIRLDKDSLRIVGVLRDVHFKGARKQVQSSLFVNDREGSNIVSVRLTGHDVPGVIAFVDRLWHRMSPTTAISRSFLDDSFEELYRADVRQGELFATFVAVAISISALGLFGLAAFTAERRTREIGIRKVFGARTRDVVWLLAVAILASGGPGQPDRLAAGLVLSARLAAGFRLPHHPEPALFRRRRVGGPADRLGHRAQPRLARRPIQSHPRPALRIGGNHAPQLSGHCAAQHHSPQAVQRHQYRRPGGGAGLRHPDHIVRAR